MTTLSFKPGKTVPAYTFDEGYYNSISSLPKEINALSLSISAGNIGIHDDFDYTQADCQLTRRVSRTAQRRTVQSIIRQYRVKKSKNIKAYLSSLGITKLSQRAFDILASENVDILLDIIESYDLSPVNLAYALKSLESSIDLDKKAYRIIVNNLRHQKGYVREGAAYGILAFKNTPFQEDSVKDLNASIENEQFESVKKALMASKNKLRR